MERLVLFGTVMSFGILAFIITINILFTKFVGSFLAFSVFRSHKENVLQLL